MKPLYTSKVTATGGREGTVVSDDGKINMQLSKPAPGQPGTNPEQLFAAGYGACFAGAVGYIAKQKNQNVGPVEVKAEVTLNQVDDGFKLSAVLNVALPELDKAAAEEIVKEAHAFCPFSRATRGNIEVKINVNNEPLKQAA